MRDDRSVEFIDGIEPVMDATPPAPEWESLQFEALPHTRSAGRWWAAAVAAALVLVVGAGSFLLAGRVGGNDGGGVGNGAAGTEPGSVVTSIEGRWILESWEEGGELIAVEIGENADDEVWLEFTADPTGAAGTFTGSTGCNGIRTTDYEYSAGFLNVGEAVVQAVGCEFDEAEEVLLALLWNASDGIEVIMGSTRMELFGSNVEGRSYPLVFRRDGSSPPTTIVAASSTTTVAPEEGLAIRVYEVDGIEVVTPSLMADLPDRASQVQFHTMVIDSGNGPELCAGIVLGSLPPQCSGPIAAGLDMDGWSEESQGVRWGERSVTVSWPPVDGVVEVLDDSGYAPVDLGYPPGELPPECGDSERGAGAGPMNEYARSLGDSNGGLYVTEGGVLVLQVMGDPAPHREALAGAGGACVIEVTHSETELRALQDSIHPQLAEIPELVGTYSSSTGPRGRVDLYLPVVDRATAQAIAALVDDPTAIRIIGTGVLHP